LLFFRPLAFAILLILQLSGINSQQEALECSPQVARMQALTFCQFVNQSSSNKDVSRVKVIPTMFQGQYIQSSLVTAIQFAVCDLNHIPAVIYKSFGPIKWIRIHYSTIKSINNDNFKTATDLKKIEIADTKIGKITAKAFSFAKNLEELSITGSEIGSFSPDAFDDLENLKTVNLNGNKYSKGTPTFNNPAVNVIFS